MVEYDDLFDENKGPLGRKRKRGETLQPGEYLWTVCCWICDGKGRLLLTKRSPEKLSFPGYWENTGGAVQAGETGQSAMAREVLEEIGVSVPAEEFRYLESLRAADGHFYDFYLLIKPIALEEIRLQPEETCDCRWVSFPEIHEMMERGLLATPIAKRFLAHESLLLAAMSCQI